MMGWVSLCRVSPIGVAGDHGAPRRAAGAMRSTNKEDVFLCVFPVLSFAFPAGPRLRVVTLGSAVAST